MNYFKNHILPILMGSLVTGILVLLASIFSEVLPMLYPSLKLLSIFLYLKIILFLIIILLICIIMCIFFFKKSKEFKPFKKTGKYKNLKWIADIKEYDSIRGWNIWINFICPIHGVYLGRKDAKVPECAYGVLWCKHCNKEYPFNIENSVIHLEEVEHLIKDQVISALRIKIK